MQKEEFKVLSDREHVLARSGMYIGSVVPEELSGIIDFKYQTKKISPGLIKIVEEIYQNAIDEHIRTNGEFATKIEVAIENHPIEGTSVTISDNGRGIPIEKHVGEYRPVLAWTTLRAGSNFDDTKRITAGTNGVGSSLTNIFSTEFIGETNDGKNRLIMTCRDNMSSIDVKVLKANAQRGTKVKFFPDLPRFGMSDFDEDHMLVIKDRLTNLAVTYPGIEFTFNKEKIHFRNLKQLAKNFSEVAVSVENEHTKLVFAPSGIDEEFRCHSYVNGIYIKNGGSHVEYALAKIVETIRAAVKKKHKIDVLPNQIRQHLLFASWISGFKNLKFDSQTKERVTNPASDSAPIYEGIDFEKVAKSIINTPEIIDPMIAAILYKKELAAAAELRKLNKDADRANLRKIVKFTDASQKNNREQCMLFITEGDSANASILSARTQQIGSYPLRGKPLNALATDTKDLLANKEFADLISIIGHKVNHKIKSVDDLRFGKIVICADADQDGNHIRGLVLALYKKFWPEAFGLGLLYIFTTPLVKVSVGKEDLLFYSLDEFSAWEKKNTGKKYTSRYLKGLGSSTAKDFKRYFAEMDKNLKQVKLEDVKDLELFDLVFGKEAGMTDKRKEWLGISE